MNMLDLSLVNERSSYYVTQKGDGYLFHTDSGIVYSVTFDANEDYKFFKSYWFNLSNLSNKPSPNDVKLKDTVICIIEEFFRQNPDILLYLCDTSEGQQAMRNRLFLRWFNSYELKEKYYILNEMVPDDDIENYVTLIVEKTNPELDNIISFFNEIVAMFKANKP